MKAQRPAVNEKLRAARRWARRIRHARDRNESKRCAKLIIKHLKEMLTMR